MIIKAFIPLFKVLTKHCRFSETDALKDVPKHFFEHAALGHTDKNEVQACFHADINRGKCGENRKRSIKIPNRFIERLALLFSSQQIMECFSRDLNIELHLSTKLLKKGMLFPKWPLKMKSFVKS